MEKKTKTDRRLIRTQKNLRNALIQLLQIKNINEISIRELSEMADINRGTFYLHYRDPYDLFRKISNEFMEELNYFVTINQNSSTEASLSAMFQYIADNHALVQILLGINGDLIFQKSFENMLIEICLENWKESIPSSNHRQAEYLTTFIIGGLVSLIKGWLNTGMIESPKELSELVLALSINID